MSCSDPIADALTIIRNGAMVNKSQVDIPYSRLKQGICRVLQEEGYVRRFEVLETEPRATLRVY